MPKLSVVIITFNEERNIGRCLESVKDIADEIVVVDSFSTDKTREICESHGVKFIGHAFEGHIKQKNFAISQARYTHQLSLDADEALSEELKAEILKVKENWDADGYRMNRLSSYCGKWIKHSGWYPDTKLRLFKSGTGLWAGMDPHDKFEPEQGSSIRKLKGDILHYTYYSVEEHILQANKFSTIAAKELISEGKQIYYFKIFLNPIAKFIRNYILHLGFLDGFYGFVICQITANETFLKYIKAWQMRKSEREK